jgi:hypothetical protein
MLLHYTYRTKPGTGGTYSAIFSVVARLVIADVAHHVTQRGNGRQFLLAIDAERMVYREPMERSVCPRFPTR